MNFCPKCGAKVSDSESKFCAVCGEVLTPPSPEETPLGAPLSPAATESAPLNAHTAPGAAMPLPTQTGMTGSFSSPFVKDVVPTSGGEPLFTAAFVDDQPPTSSGGAPASLFAQDAPTPTQVLPGAVATASAPGAAPMVPEASVSAKLFPSSAAASLESSAPPPAAKPPLGGQAAPFSEPSPALFPSSAATQPTPAAPAASAFNTLPEEKPNLFSGEAFASPGLLETDAFAQNTPSAPQPSLFSSATSAAFPSATPAGETGFFSGGAAASAAPQTQDTFIQSAPATEEPDLFAAATPPPAEAAGEASFFENAGPYAEQAAPPAQSFGHAQHQQPAPKAAPAPRQSYPHQNPKPEPAQQRMPKQATPPQQVYAPSAVAQPPAAPQQLMPQQTLPRQTPDTPSAPAPVQRMQAQAPSGSLLAEGASAPARRSAPPPPKRSAASRTAPARRRDSGHLVRNILLAILVVLVLLFGAILGFLYWQNRPSKTIDAFTAALAARDYQTLSTTVSVVDVTSSGSEGWIALCDAFQEEATRNELSKEMSRVSADPATTNFNYPSIRLVGKPLFLFIKQYHVRLNGVSILAPGAAEGSALRLAAGDEFTDPAGVLSAEGMLYEGIMPGLYSAILTGADGSTAEYSVSAFMLSTPNTLQASAPAEGEKPVSNFANLTIENCISDDAQIFLNGQETPAKPSGGVVQLQQVELGSTISIKAEVDGNLQEASVTFSDPNVTTLQFSEYTGGASSLPADKPASEKLSAEQANTVLNTFYKSYLEAINAQSVDGIQLSTSANKQNLQARITSPTNKANTYSFVSAAVDPNSIQVKEENGTITAEMTGTCEFSYVAKENPGEAQTGSNRQAIRMVYTDGQWLVDSFTTA